MQMGGGGEKKHQKENARLEHKSLGKRVRNNFTEQENKFNYMKIFCVWVSTAYY